MGDLSSAMVLQKEHRLLCILEEIGSIFYSKSTLHCLPSYITPNSIKCPRERHVKEIESVVVIIIGDADYS